MAKCVEVKEPYFKYLTWLEPERAPGSSSRTAGAGTGLASLGFPWPLRVSLHLELFGRLPTKATHGSRESGVGLADREEKSLLPKLFPSMIPHPSSLIPLSPRGAGSALSWPIYLAYSISSILYQPPVAIEKGGPWTVDRGDWREKDLI